MLVFLYKQKTAYEMRISDWSSDVCSSDLRTNVWTYAGANAFGRTRDADLEAHPTVKNLAMVADAILDCSNPKGIILDPFAGSGTTLVAAHKTRRLGYGIELDPIYCDVILARLQKDRKSTRLNSSH